MTQTLTPCLWLGPHADQAVPFYVDAFAHAHPAGSQLHHLGQVPTWRLGDTEFMAIADSREFERTPAHSFFVNFDPSIDPEAREHLDILWERLSDGGQVLMPLDTYPFSPHYGWIQDRYGFSWQLMLTDPAGEPRPFIVPSLLFTAGLFGRAEEALRRYADVFEPGRIGTLATYPDNPDAVMYAEAQLGETWLAAMDAGEPADHPFTEAVSFMVSCADQAEIDRMWAALSRVPEAERCGWCKDEFGLSWQIVPDGLGELLQRPGAFDALMGMGKIVVADF